MCIPTYKIMFICIYTQMHTICTYIHIYMYVYIHTYAYVAIAATNALQFNHDSVCMSPDQ